MPDLSAAADSFQRFTEASLQRSPGTENDVLAKLASRDGMNPELEVWVDDSGSPVTVRIVGPLSRNTGPLLLAAMGTLLLESFRTFTIDTATPEVAEASGAATLIVLRRHWCGTAFNSQCAYLTRGPTRPSAQPRAQESLPD